MGGSWIQNALSRTGQLLVFGALLGCSVQGERSQSVMDRVTLAPTAIGIPEDRELQDVLDARAPLPSVFCVRSEKRGAVSLRVELDTPVEGNLELLSAEAEGQSVIRIETRQQIYSVRGFHAGENPACMSLKLTQGWSLARVSWAFY